jgi:hypothetical protein
VSGERHHEGGDEAKEGDNLEDAVHLPSLMSGPVYGDCECPQRVERTFGLWPWQTAMLDLASACVHHQQEFIGGKRVEGTAAAVMTCLHADYDPRGV